MVPVYSKASEIWEVNIEIKYKSVMTSSILNANNPFLKLDEIGVGMPIYVTGFTTQSTIEKDGLVIIDGVGYEAKVSDLNMPESGIIGDYQINLNNTEDVSCQVSSCNVKCSYPEPRLTKFIRTLKTVASRDVVNINDKYTIETRLDLKAITQLLIGTSITYKKSKHGADWRWWQHTHAVVVRPSHMQ